MRRIRARLCLLFALLATILPVNPCHAQIAASIAADSDYRFRGISLSDHRADLRLNLSYDGPPILGGNTGYAGLSLITADGPSGYVAYAGLVSKQRDGRSWEAGLTHLHFQDRDTYDYSEVYAGLITDNFSARLSYSPRYFGRDMSTLYTDLSAGRRLSPHVRVFAHAGALTPLTGRYRHERYDLRAGLAASVANYEVQLAVTRANPIRDYTGRVLDTGNAVVLTTSAFF